MPNPVTETGTPKLLTESTTVRTGATQMLGFVCATTSSGTVVIHDAAGATNAVSGTFTPTAGQWYPFPATLTTGLHIVIANTISITVFYNPI